MTAPARHAIILAAGRGSRMRQLGDATPKCLLQLRGRSLLEHQIGALRAAGIEHIAIVTGYRAELLAGRAEHSFHNPAWERGNMVASLACADAWLRAQPCVVSYADIFYAPAAVEALMRTPAELAITYDPDWLALWTRRFGDPLLDAETFRLAADGSLLEIGRRPDTLAQIEGQYMGLLRLTPPAWAEIQRLRRGMAPPQRDAMHMTATLQCVLEARRVAVAALPYHGEWGEVDTARDLALY
ncbi:NTP transferase domain-containing protein [Rugamonas rubra]|uniref:Choline kinase n=1 Tax=Rugamonas rubra TaxID=758825 RepID=A0A1I4N047_9BURK|nr:phosphocholine cytidylyltransferase family protein [Rugamonas rubra]SFM08725.1 Choline kinase [Rugamonas rubra]